ncbi:MAG: dipeptide epimerase [Archangiaceae bacterium]|nr:dipeptide epimerase [Archangiaceae bacterium]
MRITAEPLSVPTLDPFVIASGQVHATRSVLVRVTLDDGTEGLGEGACLPPVTKEDQPDALAALQRHSTLEALDAFPVARAALEMALLDAEARQQRVPLWRLLGGTQHLPIETDITLPILTPSRMAELAREWWEEGFRKFKVKAGHDLAADLERLHAVRAAVPGAVFQPDANGGFTVEEALQYLGTGLPFTCFEQPCATAAELVELSQQTKVPIIADESVKQLSDLGALTGVAGINLKIAKLGGLTRCVELGRAAKARGMKLMMGGMVETRLGMTAAAHVALAVGGVDFADLDTAFLLTQDPFEGGYQASGPNLTLPDAPGLGIALRR